MTYIIYTDGACKGNPGKGGWGVLIEFPDGKIREGFGGEEHTTNNRMEITAIIKALEVLPPSARAILHSDSRYAIECINWIHGWKARGWKTAAGGPVKNQDLWVKLDELNQTRQVQYKWVKGHAGHPGNERADQLANFGINAESSVFSESTAPLESNLKPKTELETLREENQMLYRELTVLAKHFGKVVEDTGYESVKEKEDFERIKSLLLDSDTRTLLDKARKPNPKSGMWD